ncbi:MAG: recombinase RecQ, partial [Microlunatus sp.]|nr:recombinase RecQ [Microlunatus sp.]
VVEQLGGSADGDLHDVLTLRRGLARDSLRLGVLPIASPEQRLAWLLTHLGALPGSGIIYTLTVAGAQDVAEALKEAGHQVESYTGRTDTGDREALEHRLRENQVKALVATSALGMGFDKPDLGFVIHLGAPSSPVAYYQQVGRAGRATDRADVILLPGKEDRDIWSYFASASMPQRHVAQAVIDTLEAAEGPLSTPALESAVDVRRTRLELLLKVLDVDGAVQRVQGGWRSTGQAWEYDAQRYERVARAREREQRLMLDYETSPVCRMRFLQESLDDETATDCGRCDTCLAAAGKPPWIDADIRAASVEQARSRLAQVGVAIPPRTMWPTGMDRLGVPVKGKIGPALAAGPGRAVARLTDLGWGTTLREVLGSADAPASTALGNACIDVLKTWQWETRPVAVVSIASRSHPELIRSVAKGLSTVGRLRYLGEITSSAPPATEPGGNSAFRLADVWNRLEVGPQLRAGLDGIPGPLLLIDDLADSRWTVTVAAYLLRRAGAPEVLPFVLASAG